MPVDFGRVGWPGSQVLHDWLVEKLAVGYHWKALNCGYPLMKQPSFYLASLLNRSWINAVLSSKNAFDAGSRARGRPGRRQNSSDPQCDNLGVWATCTTDYRPVP
jgi:hypothetical protein